jgi:hypothetical protein
MEVVVHSKELREWAWGQDTEGQSIGASSFTHPGTISIYHTATPSFLCLSSPHLCVLYTLEVQEEPSLSPYKD